MNGFGPALEKAGGYPDLGVFTGHSLPDSTGSIRVLISAPSCFGGAARLWGSAIFSGVGGRMIAFSNMP